MITLDDIREAAERIRPYVVRTPVLAVGDLLLKPESLQPIGAFKIRGAFNLMKTLPEDCAGVVAHSSGNHAQAVARAAKVLGMKAVIVMPADAPAVKRARVDADGAEVITVGSDSEDRRLESMRIAEERGYALVPPYNHPLIAAGQGTAALELIEDVKTFDKFYAPVSGGGLMAGCATAVAALVPDAEIIGVEPEDANDTALSFQKGERVMVAPPQTIADGLRVRTPGEITWPIVREHVDRIELVSDEEMLDAMAWALHEARIVLEPSGAASLAVALRESEGRCGVLLSGGNVDPELLSAVVQRPR